MVSSLVVAGCGGGSSSPPSPPPPPPPPPANSVPVATAQAVATNPDTPVVGTLAATDADGDTLTYILASQPASGNVILAGTGNASFTYTPDAGFGGADSFSFTASDGTNTSAAAAITVNVNARPVVAGPNLATSDISAVDGALTATDAEGDAVTFAVTTPPRKGAISAFDAAAGTFTYTPDPAEDGLDSFAVIASDAFQASAEATIDVEIFGWVGSRQFGSAEDDFTTTGGIVITSDGGMILGGASNGPINGAANAGLRDAFVRKLDRRGTDVWTYRVGTAASENFRSVIAHPSGNGVYAVLTSSPEVLVSASNPSTASVYRIDGNGNMLWTSAVDIGAAVPFSSGYWSALGNDGDLYVISWTDEARTSLITRVDGDDGSLVWNTAFDASSANALAPFIADTDRIFLRGINSDAAGNLIVTGNAWDDPNTAARPCANNCTFIASIDTSGSLLWQHEVPSITTSCGTTSDFRYYRSTVLADGSLVMVGFTDPQNFGGNGNGLVVNYNADGTGINWSYCDDTGEDGSRIFTPAYRTADGGILLYGTVARDPDGNTGLEVSDTVVTKLSATGVELFRRVLPAVRSDGTGAEQFSGSIVEDEQGIIYLTGWIAGELLPGATIGGDDVFIRRLDAGGNPR